MLLIAGWDGASFDLIDGWVEAGHLPVIASLMANGARRQVRSTVPAVTFPAWTTLSTAAGPGRHGLTDFAIRREGDYGVRFVNSSYRRLPTIWSLMSSAGLRVGVYGLPATYPPEQLNGIQVCGFDTPFGCSSAVRVTHPPELAASLLQRYGSLAVAGPPQSRMDAQWHRRSLDEMLDTIRLRSRIVEDLLREQRFDCFFVHFGESDTAAHHFWQFHDERSPRHDPRGPKTALLQVYKEMDAALGRLIAAAPAEADVVVVSDHGAGGSSDRVVFWNRWLADHGWLTFEKTGWKADGASRLRRAALRLLPERLQADMFRRLGAAAGRLESGARLGGICWERTQAYSEELNYYPSIWLNLRGRDPRGVVDPAHSSAVAAELADQLSAFRDPYDGEGVVERVYTRDELFDGPYAGQAPDLILALREPQGYTYVGGSSRGGREKQALRRLEAFEMTGARGTSMPGAHRDFGVAVMAGPNVVQGCYEEGRLGDAGATLLALSGLETTGEMDGAPWRECLRLRPERRVQTPAASPLEPYSGEEEREVAERLRALGYIE